MTDSTDRIRELSITCALTDVQLLLQQAKDLKANLAMELDLARDRRLAQEKEFKAFMSELWGTLRKIQAQFSVEAELLNLVRPQKIAGEQKCQRKSSDQPRTLKKYARSSH